MPSNHGRAMWKCKCTCGNECVVSGKTLRNGDTKSCGCLRKENLKKYNNYEIFDDYVVMYTTKNEPFYVDLEDFDKIKNICWGKDSDGYLRGWNGNKEIKLHRLIMNCPDDMIVDHIGGHDTIFDNRKRNLRIVTHSQNNMNVRLSKRNTSGCVGVAYNKIRDEYRASIGYNNTIIDLGTYQNLNDAVEMRKKAEEKYFKEYSYDNSQDIYNANQG